MRMLPKQEEHSVILFDGICNLCSATVKFIIRRDPSQHFRFASLQSAFGQRLLSNLDRDDGQQNSIVLLEKNKVYSKSEAVLRILRRLKSPWPLAYALIIVPRFIRDRVYSLIANNRYKWFGKKQSCWFPSGDWQHLFIDN